MYQQSRQNILLLKLHPFKHTELIICLSYISQCLCVTPGAHPYVISEMEKGVALAVLSSPLMSYFTKKFCSS